MLTATFQQPTAMAHLRQAAVRPVVSGCSSTDVSPVPALQSLFGLESRIGFERDTARSAGHSSIAMGTKPSYLWNRTTRESEGSRYTQ